MKMRSKCFFARLFFRGQDQTDTIVFSIKPTITLKKWTDLYHVAKSSKYILQIPSKKEHLTDYYIPADTKETHKNRDSKV